MSIASSGSPQAGKFFEDIGYYAMKGTVTGTPTGQRVEVYSYWSTDKKWHLLGQLSTDGSGNYALNHKVYAPGVQRFRATLGGTPLASGVTTSNEVAITVINSTITTNKPVSSIDSLKNPTITGSIYPARQGVKINIDTWRSSIHRYQAATTAVTDAAGKFSATLSYGNGHLATYSVRSAYLAPNSHDWERSSGFKIKRIRVLNATVHRTTAAEVAKTYHSGCPVGPSKLSTITMNYWGFDKNMHRGVLIVRSDLAKKVIRSFQEALDAPFPIRKMNNPNVYGGSDPKQMEDDNTSAFNCRKVTGNPYAQSPHSYGIAVDVNTVENPYRDVNGKWWPKNGKSYIDRSPRRFGMLIYKSYLTTQMRKEGFFWGGLWSPDHDYQHFEYDK